MKSRRLAVAVTDLLADIDDDRGAEFDAANARQWQGARIRLAVVRAARSVEGWGCGAPGYPTECADCDVIHGKLGLAVERELFPPVTT